MDIGIVGAGSIGRKVATELEAGRAPGLRVTALSSRTEVKARELAAILGSRPEVVSLHEVPALCDVVIEAAGAHAVEEIVTTSLEASKSVVVVSCGALLGRDDLFELARRRGARIHVPSGAIIGLDGLLAASEGQIDNITMITRKPPEGLKGSPGVEMAGIDLDAITEATEVFEGL